MISDFRGKYAFLSNFADSPLYYKGLKICQCRGSFPGTKGNRPADKGEFLFYAGDSC